MPIRIQIDQALARRHLEAKRVIEMIGVSETHLSLFRAGKVRGACFWTLSTVCLALECEPAELLSDEYDPSDLELAE